MERRHTNSAGRKVSFLISSARYTKIIDKPTYIINNSLSCIDLIFYTSQNVISKYGVDAFIFVSFLTNVIIISSMARLTSVYPSHQNMFIKYGITVN